MPSTTTNEADDKIVLTDTERLNLLEKMLGISEMTAPLFGGAVRRNGRSIDIFMPTLDKTVYGWSLRDAIDNIPRAVGEAVARKLVGR